MLEGNNSCKQVDLGLQVILALAKVSGYIKGAIKALHGDNQSSCPRQLAVWWSWAGIKPYTLRGFHIANANIGNMGLFHCL